MLLVLLPFFLNCKLHPIFFLTFFINYFEILVAVVAGIRQVRLHLARLRICWLQLRVVSHSNRGELSPEFRFLAYMYMTFMAFIQIC